MTSPHTKPIRIGLLGASRIAVDAIIKPVQQSHDYVVTAVAASSQSRADLYAQKHSIEHAFGSYEALLDHCDVDLIYIGLPPNLHAKWSVMALRSGKHVLCEKPFALDAAQARHMVNTARELDLHLIEAYHYRYHPLFERVLKLCQHVDFGHIDTIHAQFDIPVPHEPGEFRYDRSMGGGALMDLGCYPLHWARTIAGAEPQIIAAQAKAGSGDVDISFRASLEFPSHTKAQISCDMDEELSPGAVSKLEVLSSKNRLLVHNPLQPENGAAIHLEGALGNFEEAYSGTTFMHQLQYVAAQIRGEMPAITGGEDAINNMAAIEALYQHAGFK